MDWIICGGFVIISVWAMAAWTRWDNFISISTSIQNFEIQFPHRSLSGNRSKGDIRKEVRNWLKQDVKRARQLSTSPLLITLALASFLFFVAVIGILGLRLSAGNTVSPSDVSTLFRQMIMGMLDKITMDIFILFGELNDFRPQTLQERVVLFVLTLSFVVLIARFIAYLTQSALTFLVVMVLPISTLRRAKEIRTKSHEYKRHPHYRWVTLAGGLIDFTDNVFDTPIASK